jgi:hypothetical protein
MRSGGIFAAFLLPGRCGAPSADPGAYRHSVENNPYLADLRTG